MRTSMSPMVFSKCLMSSGVIVEHRVIMQIQFSVHHSVQHVWSRAVRGAVSKPVFLAGHKHDCPGFYVVSGAAMNALRAFAADICHGLSIVAMLSKVAWRSY